MPTQEISYPWYSEIFGNMPLEQGDMIFDCQIVEPITKVEEPNQDLAANIREYDVIIMSQSCDLQAKKIELVLVCPFFPLGEITALYPTYKSSEMRESLRKGHVVGFHLLNKPRISENDDDYLVVDFKSVYAMPFNFLENIVSARENRLRLLPPYREHLSQAFARFFMRVGLPVDIPAFTF
jgi:hypothetical protein